MGHIRAHIRLITSTSATDFVSGINSDGTANKYMIENFDGSCRVNARSLLGVIYMLTDFSDGCYLVNESQDGSFPHIVDQYRV